VHGFFATDFQACRRAGGFRQQFATLWCLQLQVFRGAVKSSPFGSLPLLCSVVFAVFSARCPAQQQPWTPGAIPMGSHITFGAAFPIINGQPYTAYIVQQRTERLPDGSTQLSESHNVHRRDSEGRLEDEQLASPHVAVHGGETFTLHTVAIADPVNMTWTQWGDDTETVLITSIPAYYPSIRASEQGCPEPREFARAKVEELGERMIAGVVARGCRIVAVTGGEHPISVVTETWRSKKLGINLRSVETESGGSESRMEATSLVLGEPDPILFQPPPDYKTLTPVQR
jgi:hypothetical protein